MRLVPDEDVEPVLFGHCATDLLLHVWRLLHLQLDVGTGGVLLDPTVRTSTQPHIWLTVDQNHPQVKPMLADVWLSSHDRDCARSLKQRRIPSRNRLAVCARDGCERC